ncbi:winged helix-turn-helix domain-containing protein [Desulfovibrio inopinatus]|uniref:winged helix-turn-helix domain-containing protein n=1 Tax=Desulfovibrio inopinatus TaxID=102109 RepID=UPI00040B4B09|nr:LysR family transcriptional regulator [Desulfovibrio inopinatus]
MDELSTTMRLHLWFETDDGMILGLGRARLLALVAETGSLNKAAKAMGMSYRAAWGRIKKTEAVLGEPLLEKEGGRKGFTLNEKGKRLVQTFQTLHADIEQYALEQARTRLQWDIQPFKDATYDDPDN